MKLYKKILIGLLVILIGIQFIRPAANSSKELLPADITHVVNVPDTILSILKASCYDCHSNNTDYPWYSKVQPVAWWLNNHITDGKRSLNFSTFGAYTLKKQLKKLEEIADEIKDNEMPLSSYTLIHSYAKLTVDQKAAMYKWTAVSIDRLSKKQ